MTMETLHSSINTRHSGDGDEETAAAVAKRVTGPGSGIRYYLRRTSTQAVVKFGRKTSGNGGGGGMEKKGNSSQVAADGAAGSGINYYLRRASLQGDGWDGGGGGQGDEEANGGERPGGGGEGGAGVADAMAMAVAAATGGVSGRAGGGSVSTQADEGAMENGGEHNALDDAEAGRSYVKNTNINSGGSASSRGSRAGGEGGRGEGGGRGGGGAGGGGGSVPKEIQSGGGRALDTSSNVRELTLCLLGRGTFLVVVAGCHTRLVLSFLEGQRSRTASHNMA